MNPEITKFSWDDLIFEGRNKEYGAYVIRKSYDDNVVKGCLIAFLFVVFVFGVAQVASLLNVKIDIVSPVIKGPTEILPPIIVPDPPAVTQEVRSIRKPNPDFFRVVTRQPIEIPPLEPI